MSEYMSRKPSIPATKLTIRDEVSGMKSSIIGWASNLQRQTIDHSLDLNHPVTVSIRYAQVSLSSYSNQVNSVTQVGQLLGRDELHDLAEGYDVVMQNNKAHLKVFMQPGLHANLDFTANQIASLAQKVNTPAVELYIPMYK